jgi:hypothetical protein
MGLGGGRRESGREGGVEFQSLVMQPPALLDMLGRTASREPSHWGLVFSNVLLNRRVACSIHVMPLQSVWPPDAGVLSSRREGSSSCRDARRGGGVFVGSDLSCRVCGRCSSNSGGGKVVGPPGVVYCMANRKLIKATGSRYDVD